MVNAGNYESVPAAMVIPSLVPEIARRAGRRMEAIGSFVEVIERNGAD